MTDLRNLFLQRFENSEEEQEEEEEEGEDDGKKKRRNEEEVEEEVDEIVSYHFDIRELSKVASLKSIKHVDVGSTSSVGSQTATAFFRPEF